MNCQLCQKELEAYSEGKLPEGTRVQVKTHLDGCNECAAIYNLVSLADRVIVEEKEVQSNPFMATRVMAGIDALETKREANPTYQRVLKPVLITVSVAAAIFIGVLVGSVYKPEIQKNNIPVELSYLNDAALESVDLIANN